MEDKVAVIEALLFASETPLTAERVAEILSDLDKKEIAALLERLMREYETRGGGISLQAVAGGYQFRTRTDLAPWIRKLRAGRPAMLSPAAMETLAVVAYRQPLVKSEIDRIRGVDASGALKGLLDKKIVRIVGRKDVPGKPIIYGTTRKFLEIFNLKELSELPTLRELRDLPDLPDLPEQQELLDLSEPPLPPEPRDPPTQPVPPVQNEPPEPPEPQEAPVQPLESVQNERPEPPAPPAPSEQQERPDQQEQQE